MKCIVLSHNYDYVDKAFLKKKWLRKLSLHFLLYLLCLHNNTWTWNFRVILISCPIYFLQRRKMSYSYTMRKLILLELQFQNLMYLIFQKVRKNYINKRNMLISIRVVIIMTISTHMERINVLLLIIVENKNQRCILAISKKWLDI